jgi:hypothetical protein
MGSDEMSKIQELFDNLRADKYPLEKYNSIGKRGVQPALPGNQGRGVHKR